MITKFPFLVVLWCLFAFCSSPNKLPNKFMLFEGTWQLENTNTYEKWVNEGAFLKGHVIKSEKEDTLVVENLRIIQDKQNIYYEATVPTQNQGRTIRFKLTETDTNRFQFENPEHDFPQKIIYNFTDEKSITATISSLSKEISFNYKRIKL